MTKELREPLDLAACTLALDRSGGMRLMPPRRGPPVRIDGHTISAPALSREAPHGGEMHPDGDELLVLLSGHLTVVIEDEDPPREVELSPGRALVVPRGVFHRVKLHEPSQILHITPGPGGEHRPRE